MALRAFALILLQAGSAALAAAIARCVSAAPHVGHLTDDFTGSRVVDGECRAGISVAPRRRCRPAGGRGGVLSVSWGALQEGLVRNKSANGSERKLCASALPFVRRGSVGEMLASGFRAKPLTAMG